MKSREEILRRIKNANSWRETEVTLNEAYKAFSNIPSSDDKLHITENKIARNTVKTSYGAESDLVREMKEKIDRLTDANKKLRDENKALKAGGKK